MRGKERDQKVLEDTQKSIDEPLLQVDIGFFADNVGVSSANTLDFGQGVHDLTLAINVGVQQTENVL